MSETFTCDDKEQLVAYLYDDLDGITRLRIDEHLRLCAACAAEVDALSGVRRELATWTPPEAALGFRVVQEVEAQPSTVESTPAPWWQRVPAWAQAAAAVLAVAAGLSIANLQIRYGDDGLVITTGWLGAPSLGPGASAGVAAAATPDWQPALAELAVSLRQEMHEVHAADVAAPAAATATSRGTDVSMQRVADLIEQSERRQRQELALRLVQFGRDLEVQRRTDLVRINQGFGQFEGRAGAEIARQRQMLDYILRVSAQPPPQ
jgi:hypothetical protein